MLKYRVDRQLIKHTAAIIQFNPIWKHLCYFNILDEGMNRNMKKEGKEVLISLEENLKRKSNNNDESASDSDMKNNDDDQPIIFLCNLCHHEDASKLKLMKSKVNLDLTEKEQEMLLFRFNIPVKLICHKQYRK